MDWGMHMAIKVGLIGCGSIGHPVLTAMDSVEIAGVTCEAVLVRRSRSNVDLDPRLTPNADEFFEGDFAKGQPDGVVQVERPGSTPRLRRYSEGNDIGRGDADRWESISFATIPVNP